MNILANPHKLPEAAKHGPDGRQQRLGSAADLNRKARSRCRFCLCLVLVNCVTLFAPLFVASPGLAVQPLSAGQTVSDIYQVTESSLGGIRPVHKVPLPEGVWSLVRFVDYSAGPIGGAQVPMRTISLGKITEQNMLGMGLFIRTNASSQPMKWTDEPCKGSDFAFMNNFDGGIWRQKCVTIRLQTFLQHNNPQQNQSREFYASRGIKFPSNTLAASITRLDDAGRYLSVTIYVFPEQYGFENPVETVLARHPWHVSNLKADPEKIKFISSYATWVQSYADVLFSLYEDPSRPVVRVKSFTYSSDR